MIKVKTRSIIFLTLPALCIIRKAFIKPFEAPQKSVKIKILVNFSLIVRDRDGKG